MTPEKPQAVLKHEQVSVELPVFSDKEIIALIKSGEKVTRSEKIDWRKIAHEEGEVFDSHVERLARQMKGPRGQLIPILVRVILREGKIIYQIADGFHRVKASPKVPIEFPKAEVMYNCDDEEFFDLRITAAQNVAPVKFARMGKWVLNSFAHSKWAKKGLTLTQLSGMALQNSSGIIIGLTTEEAEEAKEYIREKATRWGESISSFMTNMSVVEQSAPELVGMTRSNIGGASGNKYLNPARLRAISDNLPKDFAKQKIAGKVVTTHNLNTKEAGLIALALKHSVVTESTVNLFLINDPIEMALQVLKDNGIQFKETNPFKKRTPLANSSSVKEANYKVKLTLEKVVQENELLKKALKHTQSPEVKFSPKPFDIKRKVFVPDITRWWDSLPELSLPERDIMDKVFGEENLDIEDVASGMGITLHQALNLIKSVHAKYRILKDDKRIEKIVRDLPVYGYKKN